jgi:uncharacterized protein YndB with AHSA1/START domain
MEATTLQIQTKILKPLSLVWEAYTNDKHIVNWNFASPEWCCPRAETDLKPGGKFSWRMEAMDGSMGFDFSGAFIEVRPTEKIQMKLDDGRKLLVLMRPLDKGTEVEINFEPEMQNSPELQKTGWQAILNQFKAYCEGLQ